MEDPRLREHLERTLAWKRDMLKHANGEYALELQQDVLYYERRLAALSA